MGIGLVLTGTADSKLHMFFVEMDSYFPGGMGDVEFGDSSD